MNPKEFYSIMNPNEFHLDHGTAILSTHVPDCIRRPMKDLCQYANHLKELHECWSMYCDAINAKHFSADFRKNLPYCVTPTSDDQLMLELYTTSLYVHFRPTIDKGLVEYGVIVSRNRPHPHHQGLAHCSFDIHAELTKADGSTLHMSNAMRLFGVHIETLNVALEAALTAPEAGETAAL